MAIEVFKLFGSIMVDNEKANKSIHETDKKAEGLGSKFVKGLGTAAKWGAGIAAAAGAGGAALFGMANKAAQATDRIDKMSQRLGMSRKSFQQWDYVLSQNGVSIDSMQTAMKQFTKHMDGVNKGANANIDVYKRLDSSLVSLIKSGASQEEVFKQTVISFQNMEDGVEKARLAQELFGKQGQEMLPMLNASKGSVDELMKKAEELGLVMGDDAVDAGVKFTDTLDSLKRSFGSVVTKIGVQVMPIIQKFADWLLDNMPVIQEVLNTIFKAIEFVVDGVVNVVSNLFGEMSFSWDSLVQGMKNIWDQVGQPFLDAISPLIQSIKDNWDVIWESIKSYFDLVWTVMKGTWDTIGKPLFDFIMEIVGLVSNFFAERMPEITGFFSTMVDDLKQLWENHLQPMFKAIGDFINNVLAPAFKFVFEKIITPVVDACFKGIKDLWTNTLKPVLGGIIDFITGVFTGNWSKAWEGLSSIVSGVFDGLVSLIKVPINGIIGLVNELIGGLNQLTIPDWVPFVGGNQLNIPDIPLLAKGTDYFKGGMAIVGEQGPELVSMPKSSKITPNDETERLLSKKSNQNTELKLFIDGREFARALAQHVGEETAVFNLRTGLGGAY